MRISGVTAYEQNLSLYGNTKRTAGSIDKNQRIYRGTATKTNS